MTTSSSSSHQQLYDRTLRVRARIREVCTRVERSPESVELILASKYADVETLKILFAQDASCIFGENQVQSALQKVASFNEVTDAAGVEAPSTGNVQTKGGTNTHAHNTLPTFHFIGHLQTNKINKIIPHITLLHSLDRLKLAFALEKFLAQQDRRLDVLLEINQSREASKSGFAPEDVVTALARLAECPHLQVCGLMTMAPLIPPGEDPSPVRACFAGLRELSHTLARYAADQKYPNMNFHHLSMGMTQDFEIAIEEGATLVRVGSAIFKD